MNKESAIKQKIEKNLNQDKDAVLDAELKAPGQLEGIEKTAIADVRKCINTMATIGEALMLSGIILNDSGDEKKDHKTLFVECLNKSTQISEKILLRWKIDPKDKKNKWMINVLSKGIMPYVNSISLDDNELIDKVSSYLSDYAADFPENNAYKQSNNISIEIFKGLTLMTNLRNSFDFGRRNHTDEDMLVIRKRVLLTSIQIMEDLCPKLTPKEDRVVFLSAIIKQCFSMMEMAWTKNAKKAKSVISRLDGDQIKKWKRANPDGFSLQPVLDTFEQNINRLIRLTIKIK